AHRRVGEHDRRRHEERQREVDQDEPEEQRAERQGREQQHRRRRRTRAEPPRREAADEDERQDRRERRGDPRRQLRIPEGLQARGDEPEEEGRLLLVAQPVQARAEPVAARRHRARDDGVAPLVGVLQLPRPHERDERNARHQQRGCEARRGVRRAIDAGRRGAAHGAGASSSGGGASGAGPPAGASCPPAPAIFSMKPAALGWPPPPWRLAISATLTPPFSWLRMLQMRRPSVSKTMATNGWSFARRPPISLCSTQLVTTGMRWPSSSTILVRLAAVSMRRFL